MTNWKRLAIALIAAVTILLLQFDSGFSQFKQTGAYYLDDDSTSIIDARTGRAITYVTLLPDTVPAYLPRSAYQKFTNKKFHFLEVSPDEQRMAFATGEGDQWMGVFVPGGVYMKFLLYSIQTRFFDPHWTPDSENLAFAYQTPDRRLHIQVIRPPEQFEERYEALNAWQMPRNANQGLRVEGWKVSGADTSLYFVVTDSLGADTDSLSIPLRRVLPPEPKNE